MTHTSLPAGRLLGIVLLALPAGASSAAPPAAPPAPAAPAAPAAEKITIRPVYEDGRRMQYQLKLSGATAWTPAVEGVQWGKMSTDFRFVLATKVIRDGGACTFNLLGEHLRSAGEGPSGAFGVDATRDRTLLKVKDGGQVSVNESPLTKPMTVTLGPLGAYRFGTGLLPLVIYMLPHVDHAFWTALTVAPAQPVTPGDNWRQEIQLPVPGSKDKPLTLNARWRVLGWQSHRGRKVLAMTLEAELDLDSTNLMLLNGDVIHVTGGLCEVKGLAQWDVEHGLLSFASADQKILVQADKPAARALRSEAACSLDLLAARKADKADKSDGK